MIIVVISWLLLRFTIQKNLLVLGLIPVSKRVLEFLLGLIIALGIHAFFIYLSSVLGLNKYTFKNDFQVILLFKSFIYHLRSALTEDLIFRGALLFLLMYKSKNCILYIIYKMIWKNLQTDYFFVLGNKIRLGRNGSKVFGEISPGLHGHHGWLPFVHRRPG